MELLVEKLGHSLEDVRGRAFDSLKFKMEANLIKMEDLTRTNIFDKLLQNLVSWCKMEKMERRAEVLEMCLLILKSSNQDVAKKFLENGAYHSFEEASRAAKSQNEQVDAILGSIMKSLGSFGLEGVIPEIKSKDGSSKREITASTQSIISLNGLIRGPPGFRFPVILLSRSDNRLIFETGLRLSAADITQAASMTESVILSLFENFPAPVFLQQTEIFMGLLQQMKGVTHLKTIENTISFGNFVHCLSVLIDNILKSYGESVNLEAMPGSVFPEMPISSEVDYYYPPNNVAENKEHIVLFELSNSVSSCSKDAPSNLSLLQFAHIIFSSCLPLLRHAENFILLLAPVLDKCSELLFLFIDHGSSKQVISDLFCEYVAVLSETLIFYRFFPISDTIDSSSAILLLNLFVKILKKLENQPLELLKQLVVLYHDRNFMTSRPNLCVDIKAILSKKMPAAITDMNSADVIISSLERTLEINSILNLKSPENMLVDMESLMLGLPYCPTKSNSVPFVLSNLTDFVLTHTNYLLKSDLFERGISLLVRLMSSYVPSIRLETYRHLLNRVQIIADQYSSLEGSESSTWESSKVCKHLTWMGSIMVLFEMAVYGINDLDSAHIVSACLTVFAGIDPVCINQLSSVFPFLHFSSFSLEILKPLVSKMEVIINSDDYFFCLLRQLYSSDMIIRREAKSAICIKVKSLWNIAFDLLLNSGISSLEAVEKLKTLLDHRMEAFSDPFGGLFDNNVQRKSVEPLLNNVSLAFHSAEALRLMNILCSTAEVTLRVAAANSLVSYCESAITESPDILFSFLSSSVFIDTAIELLCNPASITWCLLPIEVEISKSYSLLLAPMLKLVTCLVKSSIISNRALIVVLNSQEISLTNMILSKFLPYLFSSDQNMRLNIGSLFELLLFHCSSIKNTMLLPMLYGIGIRSDRADMLSLSWPTLPSSKWIFFGEYDFKPCLNQIVCNDKPSDSTVSLVMSYISFRFHTNDQKKYCPETLILNSCVERFAKSKNHLQFFHNFSSLAALVITDPLIDSSPYNWSNLTKTNIFQYIRTPPKTYLDSCLYKRVIIFLRQIVLEISAFVSVTECEGYQYTEQKNSALLILSLISMWGRLYLFPLLFTCLKAAEIARQQESLHSLPNIVSDVHSFGDINSTVALMKQLDRVSLPLEILNLFVDLAKCPLFSVDNFVKNMLTKLPEESEFELSLQTECFDSTNLVNTNFLFLKFVGNDKKLDGRNENNLLKIVQQFLSLNTVNIGLYADIESLKVVVLKLLNEVFASPLSYGNSSLDICALFVDVIKLVDSFQIPNIFQFSTSLKLGLKLMCTLFDTFVLNDLISSRSRLNFDGDIFVNPNMRWLERCFNHRDASISSISKLLLSKIISSAKPKDEFFKKLSFDSVFLEIIFAVFKDPLSSVIACHSSLVVLLEFLKKNLFRSGNELFQGENNYELCQSFYHKCLVCVKLVLSQASSFNLSVSKFGLRCVYRDYIRLAAIFSNYVLLFNEKLYSLQIKCDSCIHLLYSADCFSKLTTLLVENKCSPCVDDSEKMYASCLTVHHYVDHFVLKNEANFKLVQTRSNDAVLQLILTMSSSKLINTLKSSPIALFLLSPCHFGSKLISFFLAQDEPSSLSLSMILLNLFLCESPKEFWSLLEKMFNSSSSDFLDFAPTPILLKFSKLISVLKLNFDKTFVSSMLGFMISLSASAPKFCVSSLNKALLHSDNVHFKLYFELESLLHNGLFHVTIKETDSENLALRSLLLKSISSILQITLNSKYCLFYVPSCKSAVEKNTFGIRFIINELHASANFVLANKALSRMFLNHTACILLEDTTDSQKYFIQSLLEVILNFLSDCSFLFEADSKFAIKLSKLEFVQLTLPRLFIQLWKLDLKWCMPVLLKCICNYFTILSIIFVGDGLLKTFNNQDDLANFVQPITSIIVFVVKFVRNCKVLDLIKISLSILQACASLELFASIVLKQGHFVAYMWENVSNHCKINGNFESQNKIEWLKVLKQLSFSKCGQEALLKFLIPGPSLSELIDIMESFSIEFQEVVFFIIRNLSFLPSAKLPLASNSIYFFSTFMLSLERILSIFASYFSKKSISSDYLQIRELVSSALWSLAYNNQKVVSVLKSFGIKHFRSYLIANSQNVDASEKIVVENISCFLTLAGSTEE